MFDFGANVFRMDTETGETWRLVDGVPFRWEPVTEPASGNAGEFWDPTLGATLGVKHES